MNTRPFKIFPVFLLLLFLTGCATSYQVRVDGLSASGQATSGGRSYHLVSDLPEVKTGDLFFKEVARALEPVLRRSGFQQAASADEADLVIGVKAYLSDPMVETRSYSEPVYYNDWGHDYVVRVPIMNKQGQVVSFAYRRYWSGPRYQFAGYVDHDRQYTVYDKILRLSARDSDDEEAEEVWALTVSLRDGSTDYRSTLPYMLVAAQPYIGRRTAGELVLRVKEDSEDVADLKALLQNAR